MPGLFGAAHRTTIPVASLNKKYESRNNMP